MDKVAKATEDLIKTDLPEFRTGDTVAVGVKVIEGNRQRLQFFEGVVIAISAGHGLDKSFTVRKISNGVGVERIFPTNSPLIKKIEVNKKGSVRRSKIF